MRSLVVLRWDMDWRLGCKGLMVILTPGIRRNWEDRAARRQSNLTEG